jgi:hypothetical protein
MIGDPFTQQAEDRPASELALSKESGLSPFELACLHSFVLRLGDRIADDTTPFTSTERKRLAFLQWLNAHDKLLH